VMGLVLLLGFAGPLIPYKKVANSVCPISGSTRTETKWFGYFNQEKRTATALETWLKKREPGFEPRWRHRSTQVYYVLGRSCGTSGSPVICALEPILDRVVQNSSEAELTSLVAVLRSGTREEQWKMIQDMADKEFERK